MDDVRPNGKAIGLLWLLLVALLAITFAFGLSFFARKIPMSFEARMAKAIGSPADKFAECPSSGNLPFQKILSRLNSPDQTSPQIPMQIRVLNTDTVNALAYLGGEIFVFKGLIEQAESAEELAGVIAHEMEHVQQRHLIQAMVGKLLIFGLATTVFGGGRTGELMPQIMSLKFTSAEEEEADRGALERLKKAGIDRKGFVDFFKRMKRNGEGSALLSDHPSHRDRIAMAEAVAPYPSIPILAPGEWEKVQGICN